MSAVLGHISSGIPHEMCADHRVEIGPRTASGPSRPEAPPIALQFCDCGAWMSNRRAFAHTTTVRRHLTYRSPVASARPETDIDTAHGPIMARFRAQPPKLKRPRRALSPHALNSSARWDVSFRARRRDRQVCDVAARLRVEQTGQEDHHVAVQIVTSSPGKERLPSTVPSSSLVGDQAGPPSTNARRAPRFQWWQPGWPLTYLVAGYPLWWLLGVIPVCLLLSAIVMAAQLVRRGGVSARPGFGWWLLFLVWAAAGVLLLQVNAAGAQSGASNSRYVTFGYRYCLYLAATIALLYVYNFRSQIPTRRIVRAFAWFFVTVVFGGVLGATAPRLSFPSAMELILPHGISSVTFVHTLIHPGVAQFFNTVNLTGAPRTSAPFTYANDWGLAFGCLLPFFLLAWLGKGAGRRRHAAPWILLVAIYPVVVSQNRGLWIALVVSGLVVVVRSIVYGSLRFAIAALAGAAVAGAIVLSTPLGATIIDRLTSNGSEGGRTTLGTETLKSVAATSPVVGLGTTRNVQGSFYSIAGGDSPNCLGCAPPPFGTQGHFWLVAFSTGYVGLALYLGFVIIQLLRHIRLRSPVATLGIVVLIVHLSTMLIYDTIGVQLIIIFVAIGLLWRERIEAPDSHVSDVLPDPSIGGYVELVRRGAALVIVCALIGLAAGLGFRYLRGVDYEAVASINVPTDPSSPVAGRTGQTVDTVAQLIGAPEVTRAVERVVGSPLYPGGAHLYVTAKTNTRVLQIHVVVTRQSAVAQRAASAAGVALIAARARLLTDQLNDDLRALERQRAADVAAVATFDALRGRDPSARPLTEPRNRLLSAIEMTDDEILRRESTRIVAGDLLSAPPARAANDTWLVGGCSGLMLGALGAVLFLLTRHARGRHRCGSGPRGYAGLPVLARMKYPGLDPSGRLALVDSTADALMAIGPASILSADGSSLARDTVAILEDAVARRRDAAERPRAAHDLIVLVAGPHTTDRALDRARGGIDACGAAIAGVVVVDDVSERRKGSHFRHRISWPPSRKSQGKRR